MLKLVGSTIFAGAALAVTLSGAPQAFAAAGVKVGYLSCNVASGWGFVFGSSRDLECTYTPAAGGAAEKYKGSVTKFGADIGYLQSAVILWEVLAPSTKAEPGVLAGHYAGGTASVALGVGAGANVLVGGMHNSISLQPVSIEGQAGLNVAAGVETIDLNSVE